MPSYASTDNQQAFRCPRCDGSGKVKVGKDEQEREVDCSICGGSGRVTAARMAGYQGTPDAVQQKPQETGTENNTEKSTPTSSSTGSSANLFDLVSSQTSQSSAVEDILRGTTELPSGWTENEFQDLTAQRLSVCPRCSGMKQVFLKGKRSFCPICRGLGVTTSQRAQEWRQETKGDNDDRFTPRS